MKQTAIVAWAVLGLVGILAGAITPGVIAVSSALIATCLLKGKK